MPYGQLDIFPEFIPEFEVGVSSRIITGGVQQFAFCSKSTLFTNYLRKIYITGFPRPILQNNMSQILMDV
jgi:hypothetical protein